MATNLRLDADAEAAVRTEAQRSGRSQQAVIREAVRQYLGLVSAPAASGDLERLAATGSVRVPRVPRRRATHRMRLPDGVTSADLLGREDRL